MLRKNGVAVILMLSLFALCSAQNSNWNITSTTSWGSRVDGDEFLFVAVRNSPFYSEPSVFEFDFAYDGKNKIHNLTMGTINSRGAGYFDSTIVLNTQSVSVHIQANDVLYAQSVIKLYGFKNSP